MTERPVIHDTFVIERTYPASPSRVFAAFASKEAKDAWADTGDLTWLTSKDFRLAHRSDLRVPGSR